MAAAAAAEIVREIASVGAADLAAAAEPLRADCLRLARKVSLLSHLVAEVADAGAGAGDAAAEAWLRDLVRALEAARRFVALGRTPAAAGASDQVRRCWDGLVWLHGPVRSSCIAFFHWLVRLPSGDFVERLVRRSKLCCSASCYSLVRFGFCYGGLPATSLPDRCSAPDAPLFLGFRQTRGVRV